jgi:hypothetical protein
MAERRRKGGDGIAKVMFGRDAAGRNLAWPYAPIAVERRRPKTTPISSAKPPERARSLTSHPSLCAQMLRSAEPDRQLNHQASSFQKISHNIQIRQY